jgi:hypothetical protein
MRESEPTSQLCVACGYDLAGRALGETCPECGGTVVENPFRGAWRDVAVRRRVKFGAWALVVGALLVAAALAVGLGASLSWFGGLPATPGYASPVLETLLGVIALGAVLALLVAAVSFGLLWRADGALPPLAALIASVGLLVLVVGLLGSWTLWAVGLPLIGAGIAAMPAALARSSGSQPSHGRAASVPSIAFVTVALMGVNSIWGDYWERPALLLSTIGALGIAVGFLYLLRDLDARSGSPRRGGMREGEPDLAPCTPRTPWRCANCGQDVRTQALGEPCTECGAVLGERSLRPPWLDAARLVSMRAFALAGACLGLPTLLLAVVLLPVSAAVPLDRGFGSALVIMLFGFTAVGLIAQAIVGARLAAVGLAGARMRWMQLAASARPLGVAILIALVIGFESLSRAMPEPLGPALGGLWIGLYFVTVALIAVADIALMVRFGRFRKAMALAPTSWHTVGFVARLLLLLPTYLVAAIPIAGWTIAPIAWNALAVFTFALLWWDLTVAARRGSD